MNNIRPLLSICIPTYNRSLYLKGAIENIVSDKAFGNNVEIIISDNASTDDTSEVVKPYLEKYSNIKYFCNECNCNDLNFLLALKRASGRYVRLFNDTLRFCEGALEKMLNIIFEADENTPLFFYNNLTFSRSNSSIITNGINGFVNSVSFWITWIANFGCWRNSLSLCSDSRWVFEYKMPQIEWTFQIVRNKNVIIHFSDFFSTVSPTKKGGYNFFHIFVEGYLYHISQFVPIKSLTFQRDKYRFYKYFLIRWYRVLCVSKNDIFTFETDGSFEILFTKYWYYPYFYYYYLKMLLSSSVKFLLKRSYLII